LVSDVLVIDPLMDGGLPMRANRLRARLAAGERAFGVMLTFSHPDVVEFLGFLGADFLFIDAEHGGIGLETAKALIRACDAVDVTPLVRVPANDPAVILGFLDAGAHGIIVPHCVAAADVEAAVGACRYPPNGRRGGFSGSRPANYGLTQTAAEYFDWADREILVCPQIEDAPALDRLDELMRVPGADLFVLGPGDLSLSMGLRGQRSHPRVQAGVDAVCAAGRRHGKWVANLTADADEGRRLYERGCQAVFVTTATLLADGMRAFREGLSA